MRSLKFSTLHASPPVPRFPTAVGYRNYVEELVRSSVHDREGKTPEDEVTQVIVQSRPQFRMLKQDADNAIDLRAEVVTES